MVPDINLKLKPSILEGVLSIFDIEKPKNVVLLEPHIRAAVSVIIPLLRKLTKKLHQWQKRDNASKKYKLTLAYHEAYALYNYIHNYIGYMPMGYERNACNIVHDDLNQLLQ